MIDDFAVPDDPGYGFDAYGAGKALTLVHLGPRRPPSPGFRFATVEGIVDTLTSSTSP